VAQLVEALLYKRKGRGFDSRWSDWNFSVTRNSGASISWNPKGLCRPVAGELYFFFYSWIWILVKNGILFRTECRGKVLVCVWLYIYIYIFIYLFVRQLKCVLTFYLNPRRCESSCCTQDSKMWLCEIRKTCYSLFL
jgi:hypothetical protein